ncbi:MAG: hypothetical protein ACHQ50_14935 [Fimbriimonadales bacterium]
MRRPLMLGLGLAGALALAQQTDFLHFRGPSGEFDIEHIAKLSAAQFGPGNISVSGNPVQVFWRDKGLNLSAAALVGETAVDEQSLNPYPKAATISGSAVVTSDSEEARAYQVKLAQSLGKDPPPADPRTRRITLSSQLFTYSGDYLTGRFTMPGEFTGTLATHGTENVVVKPKKSEIGKKPVLLLRVFDDAMEVHGVSGTIELLTLASTRENPLRTGTINGPVKFKYTRHSTLDGKPEHEAVVNGSADRIDMDFSSPVHTITFTGNVKVDGDNGDYVFSSSNAKTVLTLGPHDELHKIDSEGSPIKTNVKPVGGGR